MKRISVLLLGLIASSAFAQVKISELPAAAALDGSELVPVVQGSTVQTTTGDIADLASAGLITTGSFTVTWTTGCTTQPTQNFNYTKIGNLVFLQMVTGVSCTSNSAAWNGTGVPAAIRPTTTETSTGPISVIDSGTNGNYAGCLRLTVAGGISAARTATGGQWCGNSWTASGTKALSIDPLVFIGANTVMYTIY